MKDRFGIEISSRPCDCHRKGDLFSCGCHVWNDGDEFIIKPCSLSCPIYKMTCEVIAEEGKDLTFRIEGTVH